MSPSYNDLTPEQKKEVFGQCNFFWLSIVTMTAWICGLTATAYCSFVQRNIEFSNEGQFDDLCEQIGDAQCNTMGQNHGVGFYGWQTTIPVDQIVCMSYTQYVSSAGGYVTPWFDTNFNMALASAFIADIFGGIAFFTIFLAACCPLSKKRLSSLSCCYFIACLFQGFTLLIFQSNVCDKGFFLNSYFKNVNGTTDAYDSVSVSCSLDTGSNLAITATVFYFLGMLAVHKAIPPAPILSNRGWDDEMGDREQAQEVFEEQAELDEPKS